MDDIVFGSTINHIAHEISEEMKREFEMSMVGELNYFLGLQVKQWKDGIFISQEKYAKILVKRFDLDSKKHTSTPMSSSVKLSLDVASVEVDPTLYQSMIGSLLYLTTSRLDIAFSVGSTQRVPLDSNQTNYPLHQWHIRLWNLVFKRLE